MLISSMLIDIHTYHTIPWGRRGVGWGGVLSARWVEEYAYIEYAYIDQVHINVKEVCLYQGSVHAPRSSMLKSSVLVSSFDSR